MFSSQVDAPQPEGGETPLENSIPTRDFDLCSTLESGQVFRYVRMAEGYLVHRRDRVFRIRQRGQGLYFNGIERRCVVDYFGLDENYGAIVKTLVADCELKKAVDQYWGLRILRQDPWECLVSFLCSSTKSIVHIRVLIERLCRAFGKPITLGGYHGYAFPCEGILNDLDKLKAIGLGFRARYIHEVNRIIRELDFGAVASKPYGEARAFLMGLPGVGEKIADCVLLFSMGFLEAFPVDTWIRRGMEETYFRGEKTSLKRIRAFAQVHFGPFAGYGQQYLYHFWRMGGSRP